MSTCNRCGKWNGAHATLPGQPRDHLCHCQPHATSVKIPTTADEAALMVLLGTDWLKNHAPERLRSEPEPTPEENSVVERERFEAWCAKDNPRYHPTDDNPLNRRDWKVWQAARASLPPAPTKGTE
jgi:hypothetical protein